MPTSATTKITGPTRRRLLMSSAVSDLPRALETGPSFVHSSCRGRRVTTLRRGSICFHSSSASLSPALTSLSNRSESAPASSVRNERSRVSICETLTTESRGRPLICAGNKTFPGASANRRLLVMTATMTVRMLLRLKESAWRIRTGRRKPGSEPRGSGSSAHQISPRVTGLPVVLLKRPKLRRLQGRVKF